MVVIEAALDGSDKLAERAMKRLDELSRGEKEARANVSARPRLSYEYFDSNVGQFPTFAQNQKELYKMFADKTPPMVAWHNNFSS